MNSATALIARVDSILEQFTPVDQSWKYSQSLGGWFEDKTGYESLMTETLSLLEHIYGKSHPHFQRAVYWYNQHSREGLRSIQGIVQGTRANIESGFLINLEIKITIDIKTDFLATAREFADAGDKDPAAVLASCVLEDSLKRLANRHNLEKLKNQEMSVVANGLLAEKIIEKSTLSSLLGFRNLRNAAFHAQWHEVSLESVNMLLMFLPVFIEKHGV
ncbi:MAG: hypothetical protein HWD57_03895 [Candidatus Accumulibacter cognatus]|uniref:DUF4145 domain-containing protein n=1 Tax=Candidatus Accumulibacter cognatus TaxID=2954383 RepID=A0A7D5N920_9PROT|nr:MAG: hypothetical protein HWD57_03895 [Candidatus Accumulibacter cognatus]